MKGLISVYTKVKKTKLLLISVILPEAEEPQLNLNCFNYKF